MNVELPERCELLVVGGGIQGACLARDAAGRGVATVLVEQHDLAAHTSSASSKLAHGGLRYLEQGHVRLVREALRERETLLRIAPHLVRPLRFVLPHTPALRPVWMLRAGLFLYDRLGGARSLPGSEAVSLVDTPWGEGLSPTLRRGFVYSDCHADDARLVVANARDAAARGAVIAARTRLLDARRDGAHWHARVQPLELDGTPRGEPRTLRASMLVNAAGPWVGRVLGDALAQPGDAPLRLVQGSHVVVPKRRAGEHALILQQPDGRVVFLIPFGPAHDMLGTTDWPLDAPPARAQPTDEEIDYLLAAAARFLAEPFTRDDIVHAFAGVRSLHDDRRRDAARVTRDDTLVLDARRGAAPLLTIYGGKLTTSRRVAERVLEELSPWLAGRDDPWTAQQPLPGGTLPGGSLDAALAACRAARPWLAEPLARALLLRHGGELDALLAGCEHVADLGAELSPGLHERELRWFVEHEFARDVDDVLWRRSKLGLFANATQRAAVAAGLRAPPPTAGPRDPSRAATPEDPGRR